MMPYIQTASIDHLFAMGSHFAIPIALAVIPAKVDRSLASVVQGRDVTIFQHGWDHKNQASPAAYKAELAVGRAAEEVREQLWNGWSRLVSLFADRLLPSGPSLQPTGSKSGPSHPRCLSVRVAALGFQRRPDNER